MRADCICHGGTPSSGAGSPWVARQASRTTATARISMPIDRCRLISVSGLVSRLMSGMVQATTNCTISSARISQCSDFAVPV